MSTYTGRRNQVISHKLHGTAIEAFWTGTSFLLSSTVFQLPIAALSDIFGRRLVLTVCIIFFLVGIIIASVANDFIVLLVGRTIQGMGGGGVILLNRIIITDLVPLRHQGAYLGITNAMWALGSVSGPVIGGALASTVTWVSSTLKPLSFTLLTREPTEMDLLDKRPFRSHRSRSHMVLPPSQTPWRVHRIQTQARRLDWHHLVRSYNNQCPRTLDLGWCAISLVVLAGCCTFESGHGWLGCLLRLRVARAGGTDFSNISPAKLRPRVLVSRERHRLNDRVQCAILPASILRGCAGLQPCDSGSGIVPGNIYSGSYGHRGRGHYLQNE